MLNWLNGLRALALLSLLMGAPGFAAPDHDALLQAKERLRAGFESEVTTATREIDSGQYEGPFLAHLLRDRGVNYSHLLAYDKAIADFTRAIEIDGFNPQFYQDRAIAYLRAREFAKAETDLAMVLGLDRNNFGALREKGRIAFYQGDLSEAVNYFLQASRNVDAEGKVYSMLWVSIAAQRAGRPSPLTIQSPNETARGQWPVPVAELFTGASTPEKLLERAESDNPRTHLMLQCEAQFYLGEYYLMKGEKELARASFNAAVETGITDFMEYDWALRELELLNVASK